jgi:hypothetical protein
MLEDVEAADVPALKKFVEDMMAECAGVDTVAAAWHAFGLNRDDVMPRGVDERLRDALTRVLTRFACGEREQVLVALGIGEPRSPQQQFNVTFNELSAGPGTDLKALCEALNNSPSLGALYNLLSPAPAHRTTPTSASFPDLGLPPCASTQVAAVPVPSSTVFSIAHHRKPDGLF